VAGVGFESGIAFLQCGPDEFRIVLYYPLDEVFGALAIGLRYYPKLKVLGPVVRFKAVLVMHVFERLQRTA
jgi:hypothetical protein